MSCDVVIHHLKIDGIFLFHCRDPAANLFTISGDIEEPIITITDQPVGGFVCRDGSAVDGNGDGAGEGAEARIDDVGGAADCDGDEHMLAHAFVARFEEEDAGGVPDRGEADLLESGED